MQRIGALIFLFVCVFQIIADISNWFWWIGVVASIYAFINPESSGSYDDSGFDYDDDHHSCDHHDENCGDD